MRSETETIIVLKERNFLLTQGVAALERDLRFAESWIPGSLIESYRAEKAEAFAYERNKALGKSEARAAALEKALDRLGESTCGDDWPEVKADLLANSSIQGIRRK